MYPQTLVSSRVLEPVPRRSGGRDVPRTVGTSVVGALGLWICTSKLWLPSIEKAGLGSSRLSFYRNIT